MACRRRILKLVEGGGAALLLLGMLLFFIRGSGGLFGEGVGPTTRVPLGDPCDVAVDSLVRIYVADAFAQRIQRFSSDGRFDFGWPVNSPKPFAIRTTAGDRVEVAKVLGEELNIFTADGVLVRSESWNEPDLYRKLLEETRTRGNLSFGAGRIYDAGTGRTIINDTAWLRLTAAPFPAFLYVVAGLAVLASASWAERRNHPPTPAASAGAKVAADDALRAETRRQAGFGFMR